MAVLIVHLKHTASRRSRRPLYVVTIEDDNHCQRPGAKLGAPFTLSRYLTPEVRH